MIVDVAMVVASGLWCLRNFVAVPWLGIVARLAQLPRLAGLVRLMRPWTVLCALAIVVATLVQAAPFNARIIQAISDLLPTLVVGPWLVAWPLYLLALYRRIRRVQKDRARQTPPRLIREGDVTLPDRFPPPSAE